MKRIVILALALGILLAAAPAALAYDRIVGCVTDGKGNPWTHGGTITCTRLGVDVGSGNHSLDANGCFELMIGNGPSTTCTIDFNPGPNGDPPNATCNVPTNNSNPPVPYTGCNPSTGTGPNAVTLSESPTAAASASTLPGSYLAWAALALLAGIVVVGARAARGARRV